MKRGTVPVEFSFYQTVSFGGCGRAMRQGDARGCSVQPGCAQATKRTGEIRAPLKVGARLEG